MSKKRTKQYLLLLMVIGLVSIAAGGSGTFASFNAETTNAGNYFATGTLFLHNTHGSTTCTSESHSGNINPGTDCDTLFTLPIIVPGQTYTAHLVLQNAGTIDASDIKMFSGGCTQGNGTTIHALLNGAVTSGASNGGSLTVFPLAGHVANGDTIVVSSPDGQHKQTFTASAVGNAGDTSVSVNTVNWNYSYPDQSDVNDTSSTVTPPSFATANLCSALKIAVEETNSLSATQRCSYGTTLAAASCTLGSSGSLAGLPTSGSPATLSLTPNLGTNSAQLLSAGQSREFNIKVLAPASMDNTYQDRSATFDLTWHIDQ
jgi:predicted ribosomally synthesized peptide with SipW-like signal peptide